MNFAFVRHGTYFSVQTQVGRGLAVVDVDAIYDGVPDDIRAEAAEQRRRERWTCPECRGGFRMHAQGCPEARTDDEVSL